MTTTAAPRASTLARARDVHAQIAAGLTVTQIAEREHLTPRRVRDLRNIAAMPDTSSAEIIVPAARPVRKISDRTFALRAMAAVDQHLPLSSLDRSARYLWFELAKAIHKHGDQDGLRFGVDGQGFESRAVFVAAFHASEDDLSVLFRRGLLLSLADGGVGIPQSLGLRAWGSVAAPTRRTTAARPSAPSDPRPSPDGPQRSFLLSIPGGLDAGGGNPAGNVGGNISPDGSVPPGNVAETGEEISLARASTTTTKEKDALQAAAGSTRAIPPEISAAKISVGKFPDDVVIEPFIYELTKELAVLAGDERLPGPTEFGLVDGWLCDAVAAGVPLLARADLLRTVIRTVCARPKCPSHRSLGYFEGPVRDALKARAPPLPA